ncbi:polysaccharide deacetylase family protein [Polyangium jinanense]|uniref:Polysaccharide deacetylase family protein n=1 Tax=Polyangium jinanense TaxID=2829994 RepID=A0A9X3X4L2_9BACT|nr:polysaccharide deacetylase family protein [Polyangium jinanense]MDC3962237.1 polysaccharide deacetylase family protein [Polyangium jinanense]MDC3983609.1 polysaccharide deacetylase family protein [Polyangium jinanense]
MRRATLTFDNGPDRAITPAVLDILRRRNVPAHFFVLGKHLAEPEGRALVARAVAEAHCVGNHSFTHEIPLGDDPRPDAVAAEIAATDARLKSLVPGPKRFRPFGGGGILGPHLLSRAAVTHLVEQGYSCVLWTSVPRDWVDPNGWVARALADCLAQPHAVVVLHDIPDACLAGLEGFLDAAEREGIELVTDLPLSVTPILDGKIVGDLDAIVAK